MLGGGRREVEVNGASEVDGDGGEERLSARATTAGVPLVDSLPGDA